MENIVNTNLLEYQKSTFLIDLIEHDSGGKHVRIIQTSQNQKNKPERSIINISFELLPDLVNALNNYAKGIKTNSITTIKQKVKTPDKYFSETELIQIEKRYLKGISIKDLTIQFDTDEASIKYILKSRDIEIVQIDNQKFKTSKKH